MRGNLGQVRLGSIRGWAYSDNNDKPVKLSVFLDNLMIDEILADLPRKDVSSQLKSPINCGFNYFFPENIDLSRFKQLKVLFTETLVNLNGSPFDLAKLNAPKEPILVDNFFMHIPKTAGTSFRIELLHYFGERGIYPNDRDIEENNNQYPKAPDIELPEDRKNEIKVLSGHYRLAVSMKHISHNKSFTFLREPVARAISNLKHIQRHSINFKGKPLMEIANRGGKCNPEVYNRQCFMLWNGLDRDDMVNLDMALENLSTFDFVGITEHYDASIKLCNQLFNWELKGNIFANKAEDVKQDEEVTKELIDYLNEQNKADIELYDRAVTLFKSACLEKGIEV